MSSVSCVGLINREFECLSICLFARKQPFFNSVEEAR